MGNELRWAEKESFNWRLAHQPVKWLKIASPSSNTPLLSILTKVNAYLVIVLEWENAVASNTNVKTYLDIVDDSDTKDADAKVDADAVVTEMQNWALQGSWKCVKEMTLQSSSSLLWSYGAEQKFESWKWENSVLFVLPTSNNRYELSQCQEGGGRRRI